MNKTILRWWKRFPIAVAAIAFPLSALVYGRAGQAPASCPATPSSRFPALRSSCAMPLPPYLHSLELTETQQNKVYALLREQAPTEYGKQKEALAAMEALRRFVASEQFELDQACALAEIHAQALADLAVLHAELDARVRAVLTPMQRRQLETARRKAGLSYPLKRA